MSLGTAAEEQRANHARLSDYSELSWESSSLGGYQAIRWEFTEDQDGVMVHKIDTFIQDENNTGFAVLMQAPVSRFESLRGTFERSYQTFFHR